MLIHLDEFIGTVEKRVEDFQRAYHKKNEISPAKYPLQIDDKQIDWFTIYID